MRTLLLNAPWGRGRLYGVRAGSRWPHLEDSDVSGYMPYPFFMGYAAAVLERAGKPISVIDACAEKLGDEESLSRVSKADPDLIVMETSTPTEQIDLNFATRLKAKFPDVPIAFCGAHAPMLQPEFMRIHTHVDYIFRGEYELILLDLVNARESVGELANISGLIYRGPSGEPIDNGPRPLLMDIDSLPWPARHLFPMELYSDRPGGIPEPSLQMWASRGCPYQCIFCVWPQVMYGGNTYRTRNPVDIVDELEYCLNTWHFKSFYFDDDTFNIGKGRIKKLCNEITSRKIDAPWGVMARADLVDREILGVMKDAGMCSIKYGMESGVQEIIDACGKNLRVEQVEEAVKISKELGIEVHLTFTFGLPGETKETIRRTLEKAMEINPFSVQFSIATPFPGTCYFDQLKEKGYVLSENWEEYSGSTGAVHRTDALTKEDLDEALREAYGAWDLHKVVSSNRWPRLMMEGIRHPRRAFHTVRKLVEFRLNLR